MEAITRALPPPPFPQRGLYIEKAEQVGAPAVPGPRGGGIAWGTRSLPIYREATWSDRGGRGDSVTRGQLRPRGHWLCLETVSVASTREGLHLVGRGQGAGNY